MPKTVRILYCHCSNTGLVPAKAKAAALKALAEAGLEFEAVPDLCELAAKRDPALARLAKGGPLRIIACYPRTIRWLFAAAGSPLAEKGIEILNLRADGAKKIVAKLGAKKTAAGRETRRAKAAAAAAGRETRRAKRAPRRRVGRPAAQRRAPARRVSRPAAPPANRPPPSSRTSTRPRGNSASGSPGSP